MKSILIIGSTGMLGYGVLSSLTKYNNFKISATIRTQRKLKEIKKKNPYNKIKKFYFLDVKKVKQASLNKLISNYDYVVNCVGIIKPEINILNAQSLKNAIYVNSIFPKMLALSNKDKKRRIFQIATDCVFSGKKGKYNENSSHDDLEIYGLSKSLGEIRSENFYNIRTSIIGKELSTKKSLLEWFINNNDLSMNGFVNHNWNGVTTEAFGEAIYSIIHHNLVIPNNLHLIPKDQVTKYQLLELFKQRFKLKVKINKYTAKQKIDRTLSTNNMKIVNKIWKFTKFRKKPSIKEMIKLI